MGWKKTSTNEPVPIAAAPVQAKQIQQEVNKQVAEWGVVEYPAAQGRVVIRNQQSGQELDLYEAIAELLDRTESV